MSPTNPNGSSDDDLTDSEVDESSDFGADDTSDSGAEDTAGSDDDEPAESEDDTADSADDDTADSEDEEPADPVVAGVADAKANFPQSPAQAVETCKAAAAPGPAPPPAAGPGPSPPALPAPAKCVKQIKAKTPGTNGVRKKTDKRADNVLTPSSSADKDLAANPPVVLVRGCKQVTLEAVTTPPNQPVKWKVTPNDNKNTAPTITPFRGGKGAKLTTNAIGSFSVIATLGGCKVVWNVVFVWVNVKVKTSKIKVRPRGKAKVGTDAASQYADNGSGGGATSFCSGQFLPAQYPWEATVKVHLVGGSSTKKLGINKVQLHLLQNGVADTLTGHYARPPAGAVGREKPGGGLPIRDSNGSADPFMDNPTTFTPDNTGADREVWTGDSPAGGFVSVHPTTGTALKTVTGVNGFAASIASVSSDAPNTIMVHARTNWSAHFDGVVNAGAYTPKGAFTVRQTSYNRVSAATGGLDAQLAGFETFEPRFNDTTKTIVVYKP